MTRLRRLDELFAEHPVYFLTMTTAGRRSLLANPAAHEAFIAFCQQARNHGVLVGRYVLMPDHLHLFVCIQTGAAGLSPWVKSLKNSLSKHWRSEAIDAPHWQKGFFDHLMRNAESHSEKWKYVYENPVRAGFCEDAKNWPYAGQIQPSC